MIYDMGRQCNRRDHRVIVIDDKARHDGYVMFNRFGTAYEGRRRYRVMSFWFWNGKLPNHQALFVWDEEG